MLRRNRIVIVIGEKTMYNDVEEMALDYFRALPSVSKKRLMKKIVSYLNDGEKVELAKMILKK